MAKVTRARLTTTKDATALHLNAFMMIYLGAALLVKATFHVLVLQVRTIVDLLAEALHLGITDLHQDGLNTMMNILMKIRFITSTMDHRHLMSLPMVVVTIIPNTGNLLCHQSAPGSIV